MDLRNLVLDVLTDTHYIQKGGLTRDEIIDCIEQINGSSDDRDYDNDVGRILKDLVKEGLVAVTHDKTRYSMVGVSQSRSAMLKPSTCSTCVNNGQLLQVAAGEQQPWTIAADSEVRITIPEAVVSESSQTTPLHCAAMSGKVKFLIDQSAADVKSRDKEKATPLHYAAKQKGNLVAVKLLVEKGAEIDCKDSEGATPLYNAVLVKDNLEIVEYLVGKGADVNSKANDESTPLHKAARKGNLDIVKCLVDHNSSVNVRDELGHTPVYRAARWGYNEVVLLLVERSTKQDDAVIGILIADAVNAIFSRLDSAIQRDQDLKKSFDSCMALITEFEQKKGWSTANSFSGKITIALHHAAKAGSTEMVEAMIELGVDVNIKSEWIAGKRSKGWDKTTPLHVAADCGHLEVVKILVKSKADIHRKGYRGRTPLHRACYSGHAKIAGYLLERGADPTDLDNYRNNCLHLAIKANQSEMAALLLGNEKWKEMMENSSKHLPEMPLSHLIAKMPNIAELALSKCVVTNEGQMEEFTNKVNPTGEDFKVTYDYHLLEKCSPTSSRNCCSDGNKATFHRKTTPLFTIMKSNHPRLLKHPLVTSLLKSKWDSFGRKMFFTNLSLYVLFLTFLTAFGLVSPSPLEPTCERALNGSFNGSQPDSCGGLSTVDYYFLYLAAGITTALAVLRLAMEVIQLMIHPVKYLLDWVNWLEIPLYLCSIIFAFVFATPCLCVYHWQWRFGVIAIFLGWIALITFLQKWPLTGVYFLAFVHIFRSYLKVALLALLLIIAFGLSFYLLFFEPGEMRNAFSHPGRALVKVMAMTIGELDYDNVFHQKEGEMEIAFPAVSFLLWIVFIVSMPLLLNNYLTGLAVGDVNNILSIAKETEIKLQIDLILSIEEILQSLKISHWFPDVYNKEKIKSVLINDRKQMVPKCYAYAPGFIMRRYLKWHISDRFFKTGQEIAEAIKPQPLPLELEHLNQQSKEQAQLLEVELKKQSEEQRKKLEDALQKHSEDQSQILDAKLKEQLSKQSTEQSEQLQQVAAKLDLKMQRKGEEHVRRLEAILQEQASKTEGHIRRLAGEVDSMKATVEEVLKKLDRL